MKEHIREYSVLIDSKDRNYQAYPNPFRYSVQFAPLISRNDYAGATPIINNSFTNVKYIKLEKIIMPFYNRVRFVEEAQRLQINTLKPLTNNNYLVLSLGDLYSNENYYSTNDVLSESFATIYFDQKQNMTHYLGSAPNGVKQFPSHHLGRINRLDIEFRDPYGELLTCDHLDPTILSNMECHCVDPEGDDDTDCFKHNISHPLNPLFQHHIYLKVGVVEQIFKD